MKQIFIIGAGLSASSLIKYLLDNAEENDWQILLGDISLETAKNKINNHPRGKAIAFDVNNKDLRKKMVRNSDVVISFLPARMHHIVAEDCVNYEKHMFTASYVSDKMKALNEEAKKKGLLLLNEIGVDPGIDHMSAKKVIDDIREKGGLLKEFNSSTGGLIAPESDNNPWHYKFTWNPRNVIVAGQGVSMYLEKGRYKYLPYHQLFRRTHKTEVLDYGQFEIYANRDSLKYKSIYGLEGIETIFRGTMRRPGYCEAWDVFVQLGLTDDTFVMENSAEMTKRQFTNSFLPYAPHIPVEDKLCNYVGISKDSEAFKKIEWLGMFKDEKIGLVNATPAQILQHLIVPKWKFEPHDKDMIVMQHQFIYEKDGKRKMITSSMAVKGEDPVHTAMSITVGVPVGIAVKLFLHGKLNVTGVHIPIIKEIYAPILEELEAYGIKFIEEEVEL